MSINRFDPALIKKKALTSLRLLLRGDVGGISGRVKRLCGVYTNPAALAKERFQMKSLEALDHFLFTGARIGFDSVKHAEVTIVLILWNKGEFTHQCLQSLASLSSRHVKFSVLVIDNASTDITSTLLSRVDGITVVRNEENVGFLRACNQARDLLSSPYVLFLNNDTIVHPGAIEAAMSCIGSDPKIGAVGGRIILPDGRLQEAGNILWSDGTCQGFARGKKPDASEVMFRRPTDYCSGAFLLTRTELFQSFGGFDERYLPAYYEETDYCVNLWKAGYKVIYEPRAAVTHFEFGSAELSAKAFSLMAINREKFLLKHRDFLSVRDAPPIKRKNLIGSRVPKEFRSRKRILYVEDRIPNQVLGAGFPRSNYNIQILHNLGFEITVFSSNGYPFSWSDNYRDIDPQIEIIRNVGLEHFMAFMKERQGYYDVIWVCRPDNLDFITKNKSSIFGPSKVPIIYDGEAIFSDREQAYFALYGKHTPSKWKTNEMEFELGKQADVLVAVSEAEAEKWRNGTSRPTFVVGHEYKLASISNDYLNRRDFLFLGSFHGKESPNDDAVRWFLTKIMPRIKEKLGASVKLSIVGHVPYQKWDLLERFPDDVRLVGRVDSLESVFESARVVVIPTRFAAGIPQKAFDAAEHGVPVVCTDIIARQMEWVDGEHTLSARVDDPERFADHCIELYSDQKKWERIHQNICHYMTHKAETYKVKDQIQLCVQHALSLRLV